MTDNPKQPAILEEERPLIEFPALIKIAIGFGAFLIGLSLLALPWYLALALFMAVAGMIAIFFDPYVGLIAFLVVHMGCMLNRLLLV